MMIKSTIKFSSSVKKAIITSTTILIIQWVGSAQIFDYKDSGTDFLLYDLSIPPEQNDVAYAAGSEFTVNSEGIIIKTVDGGETWDTIVSGAPNGFTHIEFTTQMRGFIVGWGNTFMTTIDGGATWQNVTAGTDIYYYTSLVFYNENVGFSGALTNSSSLEAYITTDGGDTWNLATDTSNMAEFAACFADENTLFSVGKDQVISKSTDGGNTWTVLQSGMPTFYNFEVYFRNQSEGIVSSEDGELLSTIDGGNTWDSFNTGYHHFYGLNYKGDQIFAAGTDQDIFHSDDNGDNWNMLHDGENVATFYAMEFFENSSALICGSQGRMLKASEILILENEDFGFNNELNVAYKPDSKLLTIQTDTLMFSEIQLYGINGNLILQKNFDETKETNIDLSLIHDGVYIVKVNTSGKTESIKIVKH